MHNIDKKRLIDHLLYFIASIDEPPCMHPCFSSTAAWCVFGIFGVGAKVIEARPLRQFGGHL